MKPYQTGDIQRLLESTLADRRRRGYSEFAALAVAEMKVIDLIRAMVAEGEFEGLDAPEIDTD